MKKLLVLLVLLPKILLGQEPPTVKQAHEYSCSYEVEIKSKLKVQSVLSLNQKQQIDVVEYLTSTSKNEAYDFLRNYGASGQTDIYSKQNSLKAVEYFKNEAIYLIDGTLSNDIPINFVEYFRSFDWHAWYQSEVTQSVEYIDALVDAFTVLNKYEPYWEKTEQLNAWRYETTLVLDIDGSRSKTYDLILLNLEKSTTSFIFESQKPTQAEHLSALSSIVWRAYANNDVEFITKTLEDPKFFQLIYNFIQNETVQISDINWIRYNFIINFEQILNRILSDEYGWYNPDKMIDFVINEFYTSDFGSNSHTKWLYVLSSVNYDFRIDFAAIKDQYYDLQFSEVREYDNGTIKIHASIGSDKIESMYLAMREARANFFKLTGEVEPLSDDSNQTINVYIFKSPEDYDSLGFMLFNIPTNNGGIYIEDNSAFYTFDRDSNILPLDMLVKHEYTHYLDGRYNIPGTFGQERFYDWDYGRSVFWVEGLANFVASATFDNGFYISKFSGQRVNYDVETGQTISLERSIRTSYSYENMYMYSEAAWGFLYDVAYEDLLEMFRLIRSRNYDGYFNKLDNLTFDDSLEPLYQDYLTLISDKVSNGISDPAVKRYDFTKPLISNDSIQSIFKNIGLTDFTIEQSFESPYQYSIAKKDTLVSSLKDVHTYLEDLVKGLDLSYYSGYSILTTQIDSYQKTVNGFIVNYSIEIPNSGEFWVDPTEPVDPVDPVDPEPEVTKVTLYPNPSVQYINVAGLPDQSNIFIYDLNGRLVAMTRHSRGSFRYNVSKYQTGLYILKYVGEKSGSIKFIKR